MIFHPGQLICLSLTRMDQWPQILNRKDWILALQRLITRRRFRTVRFKVCKELLFSSNAFCHGVLKPTQKLLKHNTPCRSINRFWQMRHCQKFLTCFYNGGQWENRIFKEFERNKEMCGQTNITKKILRYPYIFQTLGTTFNIVVYGNPLFVTFVGFFWCSSKVY